MTKSKEKENYKHCTFYYPGYLSFDSITADLLDGHYFIQDDPEIINAQHITYFPKIFTLENYQSLFNMMDYGIYLKNSLIVNTVISSCSRDPFNLWRIWSCQEFKFRGKGAVLLFFLITQMNPEYSCYHSYVCSIYQNGTDQQLYVIVYFLSLTNLPFCVITMRSFFERIPYGSGRGCLC